LDIDDFHTILEEISSEIPEVLFKELNGGIVVLPEAQIHPESVGGQSLLYTLGEYRVQIPGLGRYIAIFYGSFMRVFGENADPERLRKEMRKTLRHEFRHHIESLAGARDLEVEDKLSILKYKNRIGNNSTKVFFVKKVDEK
jgi:hypothetical protein